MHQRPLHNVFKSKRAHSGQWPYRWRRKWDTLDAAGLEKSISRQAETETAYDYVPEIGSALLNEVNTIVRNKIYQNGAK